MPGNRLLLVEDDDDFRHCMADNLLDAGFEVVEAEGGSQAMGILERQTHFDALVTDIQMPGRFDGNDVAKRAKSRCPGLPVIYLSGSPESLTNQIDRCDAFFSKPFPSSRIIDEIRRLMNLSAVSLRTRHQERYSEPDVAEVLTSSRVPVRSG